MSSLFSHGTYKSCGVSIAYLRSKSFLVKNKRNDDADRISILDVTMSTLITF